MVISGSFSRLPVSVSVKKNITTDGRHVHEDRQVHVAQLDDVEERLLFPGVRDGRAVVETVHGHGSRAEMFAAGPCQQQKTERNDSGLVHKNTTVVMKSAFIAPLLRFSLMSFVSVVNSRAARESGPRG